MSTAQRTGHHLRHGQALTSEHRVRSMRAHKHSEARKQREQALRALQGYDGRRKKHDLARLHR